MIVHISVITFSLLYALLRYIVFGPVETIHIPLYILNKSISLAAVLYLAYTAYLHFKGDVEGKMKWGPIAYSFTGLHIVLSLILISPAYYGKFYLASGKMSGKGEWILLLGALAAFAWMKLRAHTTTPKMRYSLAIITALLTTLHLVVMGSSGWLTPEKWHGSMPPVSLVACIASIAATILFFKKHVQPPQ